MRLRFRVWCNTVFNTLRRVEVIKFKMETVKQENVITALEEIPIGNKTTAKFPQFKKQPVKNSEKNGENKEDKKKKAGKLNKFPKAGDPIFTNPEIFMTPEDLLLNHGYLSELHEVESEDGAIISVLRIPYGKGETAENCKNPGSKRPVVLFSHGIALSAISWVFNNEENVLAYQLANKGFDCWFINARGTSLSQKHTKLSRSSKKYWAHSWNEMGEFDIPAVINHILKTCHQEQLIYIGHSMGCAQLFVAVSNHPEIASKIKLMVAYAPAVYLRHSTSPFVALASRIAPMSFLSFSYHGEMYAKPTIKLTKKLAPWVWIRRRRNVRDASWIIQKFFAQVNGKNPEQVNWPMVPIQAAHIPNSFSIRTYDHFLQNHKSGEFQKYDFGSRSKNLLKYGQPTPPRYGFENATFPVAIFYGDNDASVNPKDVQRLAADLPNLALLHRVDLPAFNHFDFITAKDVDQLLNIHVMEVISKHL